MAKHIKHWLDCSKKERIERWENCLRVLTALTPHQRRKHWNMANWGYKTECGTIACAAGHCGMDPWFIRRGLKLETHIESHYDHGANWYSDVTSPVRRFFGGEGADEIFHNTEQRPVSQVIREVKAYIKHLQSDSQDLFTAPRYYARKAS